MIYLIDASVYVFRAYYSALPDFLDRDGQPGHAVFGFARFLSDLIERVRPVYMAVAFDYSLTSSFRSRIYPAYKANREPAPPGLALQFERCLEFCTLAGVAFNSIRNSSTESSGGSSAGMTTPWLFSPMVNGLPSRM